MFICMGLAFWKAIGIVETVLQSVNKSAIFGLFLITGKQTTRPLLRMLP